MAATPGTVSPTNDDALTVCAISLLSAMLANVVHEGLGHGAVALMTGAQSGVLTTVAWSSAFDSRLVAAGGTGESGSGNRFLDRIAQRETGLGLPSLFSADECCLQSSRWDRIFLFFGCHQFWRLGRCDCRLAPVLAVADAARRHRNGVVLRCHSGCRSWAREVRGRSANRAATAPKTYVHLLLLGGIPLERWRTLESDWDSTGLAIRSARSGWRGLRAAVVAVLHSKKDRSRARVGRHRQELCLDNRGGNPVAHFHFRVGPRDYSASLESIS